MKLLVSTSILLWPHLESLKNSIASYIASITINLRHMDMGTISSHGINNNNPGNENKSLNTFQEN